MARFYGPRPTPSYYSTRYPNTHVEGFEGIMNELNAQINLIKGASLKGLIEAASMIRKDTEKTPKITPLDKGNLRSSWFIATALGKVGDDDYNTGFRNVKSETAHKMKVTGLAARMAADRSSAIAEMVAAAKAAQAVGREICVMGYSAHYAVYVHENMNATFHRKPLGVSGAKWFQAAVYRNKDKVLQKIRDNVLIK